MLTILVLVVLFWIDRGKIKREVAIDSVKNSEIVQEEPAQEEAIAEESQVIKPAIPVETKLPAKILIDVSFTSQAPFGKWDAYHEEACEEASLLMVAYFVQGKKLTPAVAEKEIQALIAYEIKNTKGYEDSTAEEVAKLGADYYGLKNLRVVYDFSMEDLKKYLAEGSPIIIPAAGRLLKNPNFTPPGPLYHNLVLVGYENDTIIANDPGTRKGEKYRYDIETLYGAIYDFPGDKNRIEKGRKAMVVLAH
ncbi:MAG: C39 family peptidase [Candidatus Moraniibacteriota bacterium]